MKATLTIEIWDNTSEEELNRRGLYRHDMEYLYRKAFLDIVSGTISRGCEASIHCVVTDNTKEVQP